jgi:hypothetical protein
MSLFGGNQLSPVPTDAASMVPLSVVRQVLQEVAENRANNLAFRQAVSDHESANAPRSTPVSQSGSAGRVRGGRGGGGRGGSNSMQPFNKADLRIKPPKTAIPRGMPKRIANQVVWDSVRYDVTITVSTSTVTETNYSFTLTSHPQYASWTALYDQWCIPQASVTFRAENAPGATSGTATLYTALDFDNITAITSIPNIEDFGTCAQTEMIPGKTVTRSIRPCVKVSTQQGSGNANSTLARAWQDCGSNTVPWFGIRSMTSVAGGTYTIRSTVCLYFAFRNQI